MICNIKDSYSNQLWPYQNQNYSYVGKKNAMIINAFLYVKTERKACVIEVSSLISLDNNFKSHVENLLPSASNA